MSNDQSERVRSAECGRSEEVGIAEGANRARRCEGLFEQPRNQATKEELATDGTDCTDGRWKGEILAQRRKGAKGAG